MCGSHYTPMLHMLGTHIHCAHTHVTHAGHPHTLRPYPCYTCRAPTHTALTPHHVVLAHHLMVLTTSRVTYTPMAPSMLIDHSGPYTPMAPCSCAHLVPSPPCSCAHLDPTPPCSCSHLDPTPPWPPCSQLLEAHPYTGPGPEQGGGASDAAAPPRREGWQALEDPGSPPAAPASDQGSSVYLTTRQAVVAVTTKLQLAVLRWLSLPPPFFP